VAALPVRKATVDIPVIRQEVEALGLAHSFQILVQELRPLPAPVAQKLGVEAGRAMLWLETLHLADGRAFVFETRWLNPEVLPTSLPDFAAVSVNEWLVSNLGYTLGDIAFTAEPADEREAVVLRVAQGAALFVTERCTWSAQDPITFVRLAHAPGYRLQTLL
jgi:GntR family histidine utilization transcriptional repressor